MSTTLPAMSSSALLGHRQEKNLNGPLAFLNVLRKETAMTVQYACVLRCIARTWSAGFLAALADGRTGAEATTDGSKTRRYYIRSSS